jgi:hypothetical protein
MRNALIFSILFATAALGLACGGPAATNNSSNAVNVNTSNANADNPLAVKTPTPEQTTNNAPTLTPVFKAFCEAVNKKDEAALRKIYSADALKSIEQQMKTNNIKTLNEYLEDDKYKTTCEVRNEQINGDQAVAEIRGDTYPNGIKIVFVKENGEWKLTTRSPAIENMKPSANANTAK